MRLFNYLIEEGWISTVHTKWHPEPGFFTKSAEEIAKGLKAASDSLKQAMARLNFYINRAGSNLKNPSKFEKAKKLLRALYGEN